MGIWRRWGLVCMDVNKNDNTGIVHYANLSILRLAKELHNELSDVKGFSERNIKFMVQFYKEYGADAAIGKQPVSQFEDMKRFIYQIPEGQNIFNFLTLCGPFNERELETELGGIQQEERCDE